MAKTVFGSAMRAAVLGLIFLMMMTFSGIPAGAADSPVLTLSPSSGELGGPAKKSGNKIGNVGKNGGSVEGTVTFRALELPADGYYTLVVTYYSGSDDRYFNLTTDEGTYKLPCPSSGGFDKSETVSLDVRLKKGGFLTVGSDWYGPDLGKIEIFEPEREESAVRVYENRREERFERGSLVLTLDAANGIWSLASEGAEIVRDARCACLIEGETHSSDEFTLHRIEENGDEISFAHEGHPAFGGVLVQTFLLRPESGNLLTEVTVSAAPGSQSVATNRIAPLITDGVCAGADAFLSIPYDNDMWAEPSLTEISAIGGTAVSYEVGALLDTESGAGTVFGSVEHDRWKSGVILEARLGEATGFEVAGGVADSGTRDHEPHGTLSGPSVKSPRIFVGRFSDWRDGLTAFAEACAETVPPKGSVSDVPFGYNSWGVLQDKVSYGAMRAASDYIRTHFQDVWQADGAPVYVNIDSYWDYITANDPDCGLTLDDALRAFVSQCRENGQKAGIYFTPFTAWHSDENALRRSKVEGTSYTYYDAALKTSDGSALYGKLDGGFALDPTHPATIRRFEDKLGYFISLGFEYVKLDFMAHGACEGAHYDPSVSTGIEAYNAGMAHIREICEGKMFVNLSIAPVFPYQYADGRRMSCDAFSSLDSTRHVLSYLTACFWEETVYPYPDPDHLVVWGKNGDVTEGEARCRVTCGAIAGTSFLVGDNLADVKEGSEKDERLKAMFANPDIVAVAKLGKAFRPWSAVPGERCADAYWYADGGTVYLAVFNFGAEEREYRFSLGRMVTPENGFRVRELWRGTEWTAEGDELVCAVPGKDAAVCKITVPAANEPEEGPGEETAGTADTGPVPQQSDAGAEPQTRGKKAAVIAGEILAGTTAVSAVVVLVRKKRAERR